MRVSTTRIWTGIALSAAGHLVVGLLVAQLRPSSESTPAIEAVDVTVVADFLPEPPAAPETQLDVEPTVDVPAELEVPPELPPPPPPVPESTPPPPPPPPTSAPAQESLPAAADVPVDVPSFGLRLEGGGPGGGVAVPVGDSLEVAPQASEAPQERRRVRASAEPAAVVPEAPAAPALRPRATEPATCDEEPSRPVPTRTPQPVYTEEAREAQIEGRIRIRMTVSTEGTPASIEVLEGLGHGLDESAVEAIRRWRFTPAQACGSPVESTFTTRLTFRT